MANIGIFYGSSSGVTKAVAEKIGELLDVESFNIFNMEEDFTDFDDMYAFDILLFGCSTWGSGGAACAWRARRAFGTTAAACSASMWA